MKESHKNMLKTILHNCARTLYDEECIDIGEGAEIELNEYLAIIRTEFTHEDVIQAALSLADKGFTVEDVQIPRSHFDGEYITTQIIYRTETGFDTSEMVPLFDCFHRVSRRRYRDV